MIMKYFRDNPCTRGDILIGVDVNEFEVIRKEAYSMKGSILFLSCLSFANISESKKFSEF